MSLFIREVKVLDPQSPHHLKRVNVLIKEGVITSIDNKEHQADTTIEAKGQFLTPGLFDLKANFCDPGFEHREDIYSGCQLAAASGYTGVATLPNTAPVVQAKSHIEYLKSKSRDCLTDIYPMAAVTIDALGEDLTEMIDLHEAGAIAFTDGDQPMWHTDIMLKSLIYLQKFDGLLINLPEDKLLTRFGTMNEGIVSTGLGLKGMPALAEHLMIKRDLDILAYSGGRLHFSNISSAESVKLIKKAKKNGLKITCDVSIHHLLHTDQAIVGYDANYKINPPLRENRDRKALLKGLKDGTIDAIVSAHSPQDEESKKLEFDRAEDGILGLQTMIPSLLSLDEELDPSEWIDKITSRPRAILKLAPVTIAESEKANVTLIDPKKKWKYDQKSNLSKSVNSPYYGKELTGQVSATLNGEKIYQTPS
ncbi:dihydroorotase [Reichenbachiella agariperforans]|uniref:dihydroorotase n=1 Tax=Reichenbachiella agariperforans TaxID=156994 RepID=UPI001C08A6FF|nr:dihydroorotase [Reichenbachiella agariperforans]MBU2914419.1 dihydroorotase [Reichenbachiella agariperforans]